MDEIALAGRKALIIGAYGGMGRAVALALAGEGAACALMGRDRFRWPICLRDSQHWEGFELQIQS